MCNLYSMTSNQEAIRRMFGVSVDNTGNLPPQSGVYPDYFAPIVRNSADGRELVVARWGMPTPPKFLEGKKTDPGVTNIRNPSSPHWRRWLNVESRCGDRSRASRPATGFRGRAPVGFSILFRGPLDPVDLGAQGEGRRDDERSLCLPHDQSQCRGQRDPPQSNACHSANAGGDGYLDDSAGDRCIEAATTAARWRAEVVATGAKTDEALVSGTSP